MEGLDSTTATGHLPILGRAEFVKRMQRRVHPDREIPEQKQLRPPIHLSQIIDLTAREFNSDKAQLLHAGRGHANVARSAAMYLSRKAAGYPLNDIAGYFGLKSYGSVSGQIHRFKQTLESNREIRRTLKRLSKIINEQT